MAAGIVVAINQLASGHTNEAGITCFLGQIEINKLRFAMKKSFVIAKSWLDNQWVCLLLILICLSVAVHFSTEYPPSGPEFFLHVCKVTIPYFVSVLLISRMVGSVAIYYSVALGVVFGITLTGFYFYGKHPAQEFTVKYLVCITDSDREICDPKFGDIIVVESLRDGLSKAASDGVITVGEAENIMKRYRKMTNSDKESRALSKNKELAELIKAKK